MRAQWPVGSLLLCKAVFAIQFISNPMHLEPVVTGCHRVSLAWWSLIGSEEFPHSPLSIMVIENANSKGADIKGPL